MRAEGARDWRSVSNWVLVALVAAGTLRQHYLLTFVGVVAFMLLTVNHKTHPAVQVMRYMLVVGSLWLLFQQDPKTTVPWFLLTLGFWAMTVHPTAR